MTPDAKTRERWWLLCYALTALQKASLTAQQLASVCRSNRDPLFLPLAVAVHSFYVRPFMDNRGVGRIDKSIVPPDAVGIHDWLMKFRNRAYSHTDTTNIEDTAQPWNDVVYEIDDGIREITTKTPCAQVENYVQAVHHFETMDRVFFREIHALNETYAEWIPEEKGHYELRIDMPANKLFIPYAPSQNSTLNFKG